jgi:hypothetical protein
MVPSLRISLAVGLAAVLLSAATAAQAQILNSGQPGSLGSFTGMMPGQMPGLNAANQVGLSPQIQQYMMLRALQGAGHHHGVHTGFMNPIIGAGPQFDPSSVWTNNGSQYAGSQYGGSQSAGNRHSSSEKRAAARAAREEQKHLARERAERNKAKVSKPAGKAKFSAS